MFYAVVGGLGFWLGYRICLTNGDNFVTKFKNYFSMASRRGQEIAKSVLD